MPQDPRKYFLTTPIYYVNARPHIGHAYSTIVADVLARRHRLLGDDTFFLTGTDEHGQKIERSAAAAGIPPQAFTDRVSAEFRTLWDRMGLTYDKFIRTTDPAHKRGAQKLFTDLYISGAIYLSSYTGQYCVSEELFVEGPPGTLGPDGRPTETVTEENFFFRLSDYQRPLIDLIELDILKITPEARKNEVLSFLRGDVAGVQAKLSAASLGKRMISESQTAPGNPTFVDQPSGESWELPQVAYSDMGHPYVPGALRDLSVSRSSFTWGIPVPDAIQQSAGAKDQHVMYVWLDALANYLTAIGYGSDDPKDQANYAHYWPADLHIMAKEITRQHCIYWPAFLLAAGLPLPKAITAHGWLLFDNAKMSKSKGNIVRTETILDAFGDHVYGKQFPDSTKAERDLFAADVLRYFLLREIPFGQDGSFSFEALITRYNADLANGYGNLVSRTLSMIQQYCEASIPECASTDRSIDFQKNWNNLLLQRGDSFTGLAFAYDLGRVMRQITAIDALLTLHAPWKLSKIKDPDTQNWLREVLFSAAEAIRFITALLYPILPFATAKVWAQLGLGDIERAARNGQLNNLAWGGLKPGTKLGPLAPIFPRADKGLAQIMTDMEEARTNPPQTSPSSSPAPEPNPSDPAAPPRTSALTESAGPLTVGGSHAQTPTLPTTPGPSADAPASGAFASAASQTPGNATPADAIPQIGIDDFMKVELRVAQIIVAERIPKADKLLRLEVDLGPDCVPQRRQILSGIAEFYAPEELIGRRIIIVANLAPRKMRGLESHGMLLAASAGEGGKPILATFGEDIALGSRVR